MALFAATVNENVVKTIEGFLGAVCLSSECGKFAFELALWNDRTTYDAAVKNADMCAYRAVVERHAFLRHQEVSSISNVVASDVRRFSRGDQYFLRVDRCLPLERASTSSFNQWLSRIADEGAMIQIAENGTSFAWLSRRPPPSPKWEALGLKLVEPLIDAAFRIADAVAAGSAQAKLVPPYHLGLVAERPNRQRNGVTPNQEH